jgi:hypothetical protein
MSAERKRGDECERERICLEGGVGGGGEDDETLDWSKQSEVHLPLNH